MRPSSLIAVLLLATGCGSVNRAADAGVDDAMPADAGDSPLALIQGGITTLGTQDNVEGGLAVLDSRLDLRMTVCSADEGLCVTGGVTP